MYILKNALKNLGRNKGRNILLGTIMFSLIVSATVALVINDTAKGIIDDYKNRFGSKVTLKYDFDKLMEETEPNTNGSFSFPTAPEISPALYMDFAKSKQLRSYTIDMELGIIFNNLEVVGDQQNDYMSNSIGGGNDNYVSPKAKLISYSDIKTLPDFKEGLRKVIEGSFYKNKGECLISSEFADLNNLKVNDKFDVVDPTGDNATTTLKIAGIYADITKENGDLPEGSMSLQGAYGNRRNEIIVGMNTITNNFNINNLIVNAEYELISPEARESFEKEIREKGLPELYNVETDEDSYNKIVAPVEGLSQISMTFMWIILTVGGIILLFITTMAIRERKYEIGVLRAMGLKKVKVVTMIVSEVTVITILCLGLGLSVGNILSQSVADTLIEDQLEVVESTQNFDMSNGMVDMIGNDEGAEPLSKIDVSLTLGTIIRILLIALCLAVLSSVAGVIFITKYEPMKILSERN